jgi:asparagine synthase (glutamine-hydrolysing)
VDRLKRFLGSGSTDLPNRYLGYVTRLGDDERRRLYGPDLRATVSCTAARDRFRRLYVRGGSPRGLAGGLYLDYKTYLPDDILALSDRLSMAHSLEVRVPFVDHELVEQVFPLSERLKIGGFRKKRLLRLALRNRLTQEQFKAPKRGFVGPTGSWLRNELRPMLEDELSAGRMSALGYFDSDVVQRLLREHFDQRHNRESILWALLSFSLWHRTYAEDASAAAVASTPQPDHDGHGSWRPSCDPAPS